MMKVNYRIEHGEVTMPISEVNRLNDEAEKLNTLSRQLIEERRNIDNHIAGEGIFVSAEINPFSMGFTLNPEYRLADNKESKKIKLSMEKNIERKFSKMSVKQFKEYKRRATS